MRELAGVGKAPIAPRRSIGFPGAFPQMLCRSLVVLLVWFGAPARADTLALQPYWPDAAPGAVTVSIEVDGRPATMLFDTGAGVTAVTQRFAQHIGCTPFGMVTGFRMRGDRLETPKCGVRRLAIAGHTQEQEILVFDETQFLPPNAPQIDGIIGLDAFNGQSVTIALSRGTLTVNRDRRPGGHGWIEGDVRFERAAGGRSLTALVPINGPSGRLWLLLDSGHLGGPVLVSPAARDELGASGSEPCLSVVVLSLSGPCTRAAVQETLIYDGVLGETFLRDYEIAIDLRRARIWWRSQEGSMESSS